MIFCDRFTLLVINSIVKETLRFYPLIFYCNYFDVIISLYFRLTMRPLLAKTANISDPSSKTDEQLKQGTIANF